jgi:ATP-dependent RNA helicase SUPV3L1/SUV3
VEKDTPPAFYEAAGYRVCGAAAVRLDVLERIAAQAWSRSKKGAFIVDPPLLSLAGCTGAEMAGTLRALGYAAEPDESGRLSVRRRAPPKGKPAAPKPEARAHPGPSPFAKLRDLRLKR